MLLLIVFFPLQTAEEVAQCPIDMCDAFMNVVTLHEMSLEAADGMWRFFQEYYEAFAARVQECSLVQFKTMRLEVQLQCPRVLIGYKMRNINDRRLVEAENQTKISLSSYPRRVWSPAYETARVQVLPGSFRARNTSLNPLISMQMQSIVQFHYDVVHKRPVPDVTHITIANDGVQQDHSNSISLNVFMVKISGCNSVYPLSISKSFTGEKFSSEEALTEVLSDLR